MSSTSHRRQPAVVDPLGQPQPAQLATLSGRGVALPASSTALWTDARR